MGECAHFSFNKCPIYTHDDASAKFSTKSHKSDNSAPAHVAWRVGTKSKVVVPARQGLGIESWAP